MRNESYTASDELLNAMQTMGIEVLFGNFGSDHPEFIESMAKAREAGDDMPRILISPYESTALAAAHGFALMRGRAQAVFVHCDVGTQTLGGALHNIARSRVPCFIFAGETPATINGELFGGRNRPVQFLQDSHDQHGIVRSYVKWSAPLKSGQNVAQMTWRALQIANSEPKGPVYLTGAREYLSEQTKPYTYGQSQQFWSEPDNTSLGTAMAEEIVNALVSAQSPLIVTSYLGREAAAVERLVRFAEALSVPVIEHFRGQCNFPADHPLHHGYNADTAVAEADVILVLDSDVPWTLADVTLKEDVKIYHLDQDILKTDLVLWHSPATRSAQVNCANALDQLNSIAQDVDVSDVENKLQRATDKHKKQRTAWDTAVNEAASAETIEAPFLLNTLSTLIDDDVVIVDETITNYHHVWKHLPRQKALTYMNSGGSSLGWHGGAALGVKLAAPEKTVVALTGDGSYLFSVPSSVHWMSRQYNAPFLTIILNNGGWNATKQNVLSLHPDGAAADNDNYWVNLGQETDLGGIAAAAGGALSLQVSKPADLEATLKEGLSAVEAGRSAVINVQMIPISKQQYS